MKANEISHQRKPSLIMKQVDNEMILFDKLKDKYENFVSIEKNNIFAHYSATRISDQKNVNIMQTMVFEQKLFHEIMQYFNTLSNLNHPNLAKYLDTIFWGKEKLNEIILVSEKFDLNLYEMITIASLDKPQPKPEDELLQMFLDIANVVNYCHNKNITHCNIDPSNIFLIHGKPRPPTAQNYRVALKNNLYILNDWKSEYIINLQSLISNSKNKRNVRRYLSLRPFSPPEIYDLKLFSDDECKSIDVYSLGMCILNFCGVSLKKIQSISVSMQEIHDFQIERVFNDLIKIYNWEIIQILRGMLKYSPGERWSMEHVWISLKVLKNTENFYKSVDYDEKNSQESSKSGGMIKRLLSKFSPSEKNSVYNTSDNDSNSTIHHYKLNTKNICLSFDSKEDYKSLVNVKPTKNYK